MQAWGSVVNYDIIDAFEIVSMFFKFYVLHGLYLLAM